MRTNKKQFAKKLQEKFGFEENLANDILDTASNFFLFSSNGREQAKKEIIKIFSLDEKAAQEIIDEIENIIKTEISTKIKYPFGE